MGYENDFVTEEVIDLDVEGYKKSNFRYKPTTAGQENEWINDYMDVGEDGKPKQDFAKLNKLKLNNLIDVPYDKATIKKMIQVEKEWKDLNIDERWKLLGLLKGSVFDKILNAINKYDRGDDSAKKA